MPLSLGKMPALREGGIVWFVMRVKLGLFNAWIPAFAGMTVKISRFARNDKVDGRNDRGWFGMTAGGCVAAQRLAEPAARFRPT